MVSWDYPFKIPAPVIRWRRESISPRGSVGRLAAHGREGGRLAAHGGEGGGRQQVRTRGHHPLLALGPLPVALVASLRLHTYSYELLTASVADPDPLVRGMDPRIQIRIRIHTKMSWIRNTANSHGPNNYKDTKP